jgi:hypothetical protein
MLVTKVPMKNQPKIRPILRVSNLISLGCTVRPHPTCVNRSGGQPHQSGALDISGPNFISARSDCGGTM